jgi:hypothetical protein
MQPRLFPFTAKRLQAAEQYANRGVAFGELSRAQPGTCHLCVCEKYNGQSEGVR